MLFSRSLQKKNGKRAQRLLKAAQRYLYHICSSLCTIFSWKKPMLELCEILRLLVKRLTDDDKYSLLYRDNLTQPIQILLSEKEKPFSHFSSAFLKSALNFTHFQKKDHPYSRCISQIIVSEKGE